VTNLIVGAFLAAFTIWFPLINPEISAAELREVDINVVLAVSTKNVLPTLLTELLVYTLADRRLVALQTDQ